MATKNLEEVGMSKEHLEVKEREMEDFEAFKFFKAMKKWQTEKDNQKAQKEKAHKEKAQREKEWDRVSIHTIQTKD